jgi:hypothetical protein
MALSPGGWKATGDSGLSFGNPAKVCISALHGKHRQWFIQMLRPRMHDPPGPSQFKTSEIKWVWLPSFACINQCGMGGAALSRVVEVNLWSEVKNFE